MERAATGWVTVADTAVLQPLLSVTVAAYVPVHKLDTSSVVDPLLHLYVYGVVPPVTVIFTDPVHTPLHVKFVIDEVTVAPPLSFIDTALFVLHAFASVTVAV